MLQNLVPIIDFVIKHVGGWPGDYTVIDVETSGVDFNKDVITEWGHFMARNGEEHVRLSRVLDWRGHRIIPESWIADRLKYLQQKMASAGKQCHSSIASMKQYGRPADDVLAFVSDFMHKLISGGEILISQNGYKFDLEMIQSNLEGFDFPALDLQKVVMIDVGAIVKGMQLGSEGLPLPGESLRGYCTRVVDIIRPGVYWRTEYCIELFDLGDKIDLAKLHRAGDDCYVTHLVLQALGQAYRDQKAKAGPTKRRTKRPASKPTTPFAKEQEKNVRRHRQRVR